MQFIRSLLFFLGYSMAAILIGLTTVFTAPLPFQYRFAYASSFARFSIWWLKVTCKLSFEVEGRENIPPNSNGLIFCKHQSAWETLVLQQVFPPQTWLLKRELLFIPFFGWGLAMMRPVAIDRSQGTKSLRQLVDVGTQRLKQGVWLVIFPEGTRVAPGAKGQYHIGGAKLAEHSRFPVIPVAHNAGEFWPKKGFIKKPGVIKLVIGPAIDTMGKKSKEINAQTEQWIEEQMTRITTLNKPAKASA